MRALWLIGLASVTACSYGSTDTAQESAPRAETRGPVACEGDRLLANRRIGTDRFRPGSVETLQYTADGAVLMSAGGSNATLWDPKTGRRTKEFDAWSGKASLSADGRRLALLDLTLLEPGLRIVIAESGEVIQTWKDDSSDIDRLALDPTGEHLAVTNDGAVEIRGVGNDHPPKRLGTLEGDVNALAFAPTGPQRVVAGGGKGQLRIWDIASGSQLELDTDEKASVTAVSFSPDAKTLAAVDSDGVVRLYDPADGSARKVFTAKVSGEPGGLRKVAVTNDGARVIVGSWSGVYSLWKPEASGTSAALVSVLAEGLLASGAAAFTPDGKTAVAAVHEGAIRFWDAQTGEERLQPEAGNLADVGGAVWLADHRAVTAAGGRSANVWDLRCGKIAATLDGHTRRVAHVAGTRDGSLVATADEGGGLRVWDGASLQLQHEDATQTDAIGGLALSDDGHWLAVGRRSGLVVHDTKTFEAAWQTPSTLDDNAITALGASPDGTLLVTGDTMGAVRWLDMSNGSSLASREEDYASNIRSIRFSPDGKHVATSASDKVRVYDAATAQLTVTFSAPGWSVSNPAWFSDSTRLAFGDSDGHLWVVDTARARVLQAAHEDALDISTVALRSDDQGLLTGHDDSSMRVWVPEEIAKATESDLEVERRATTEVAALLSGSRKTCPAPDGDRDTGLPPCAVAKLASSDFLLGDDAGTDGRFALSADGLLATPAGEQLHVVEVASGKVVSRMNCCEYGPPSAVAFSPDATSVTLTPPLGKTEVWNVEGGRKSHEWGFKATALAVSPDGKTWAGVSNDGALHLVDAAGKTTKTLLEEGFGDSAILSFSSDGTLLLGSDRWSIVVWDTATGEPAMSTLDTYELTERFGSIWWAGFDAKNNLIANTSTQQHVGKSTGRFSSKPFPLRPDDPDEVRDYSCSEGGRVCAMTTEKGLEIGKRGRGKSLLVGGEVEYFSLHGSGTRIAVSDGYVAAVWDVESKRRLTPAPLPQSQRVAIDGQGALVTVHDQALRVWKPGERAPGKPIEHPLRALDVAPAGDVAVALHEEALVRVALGSGKKTVLHPGPFWTLGLSGDGTQVAGLGHDDEQTALYVVDVASGKVAWQRTLSSADAVALSSDGRRVAVATDETIEVYSAKKRLGTMNVEHSVYQLAFSPNDALVVAVGGGHIDVYSTENGREVASLADGLEVDTFAFAGNSHTIVTGGSDNSVRLFDLTQKRQIGALQGHDAALLDVAAGGTPLRVVSLDQRGGLYEWDVSAWLED